MARTTIRTEDVTDSEVTTAKMAIDPTDASTLASGTVPTARLGSGTASSSTFLRGDQTYDVVDTSGIATNATAIEGNKDDIALLGFKVAVNGTLGKYDLVDQTEDAFMDASGVDASASTNETRNSANYYSGKTGNETITAFTAAGTATHTNDSVTTSAEILVVAGGGGGGAVHGGGGGAGGVVHDADFTMIVDQAYGVTGGAGGASLSSGGSNDGANSVFDSADVQQILTAIGGGGGGGYPGEAGHDGGSGGGARYPGHPGGDTTQTSPPGATGYGFAGGASMAPDPYSPGGGGGASAVGEDGSPTRGGNGGAGKLFAGFEAYGTTDANVASSGSDGGYFAGGAGGSAFYGKSAAKGTGGVGGGGDGTQAPAPPSVATAGLANTGGGGGGVSTAVPYQPSGAGGSGIVIIKNNQDTQDMTLISNSTTAETQPDKVHLVMTYTNGAGTATIGTDLIAYASRDNGTTYTSFGLASSDDKGDTGGHTILTSHDLDISGQPAGTTMRWKITTHNQDASKETRIQAVSLGWT